MLRAVGNSLFYLASYRALRSENMVRAQAKGQMGIWEVKKERIWAVQSGKKELQGPENLAQCLCFYR